MSEGGRRVIPIALAGREATPADGRIRLREAPPLALYVHVPWCVEKCPYCDFNSHGLRGELPETAYLDALAADLESALPLVWGRNPVSVFIGGGTPSLLSGAGLERLLATIRALLPPVAGAEITLEANPGTVEADRFAAFRDAGVTRLSLGIQSFDDRMLRALGRIHDGREARRAIEIAARHFANFNLDLMYGLPGQTLAGAQADLEAALAFAPPHLSAYQLTIEPNTAFAAAPPALPAHDLAADMQDAVEATLGAAGYAHYETSAFARPGHPCRHNLNYWTFGDYLGIGAGAHGKLTLPDGAGNDAGWSVRRQMRCKLPREYLQRAAAGNAIQDDFPVPAADLPGEFMMNALRLNDGFPEALFAARCGLPLSVVDARLRAAEADGLLVRANGRIAPSERGRHFLNRLIESFFDDEPATPAT